MGKYIDWYLVEIERRLRNRLPDNQIYGIELEVEDHLNGLASEFESQGVDHRRADRMAVQSFGDPQAIVRRSFDAQLENRGSAGARWIATAAVLAISVDVVTFMLGNHQHYMPYWIVFWILAAVFSLASLLGHKWKPIPILAAGVAAFIACGTYLAATSVVGIYGLIPKSALNGTLANSENEIRQSKHSLNLLDLGVTTYRDSAEGC